MPKPVSENTVFRDPIQHAVRADDGGVDRAGENQKSDHHHEAAENELQQLRAPKVHGQARYQVVLVNRNPDGVRDDHHKQKRGQPGEYEAVNRDDHRGALQVLELGMSEFAVDLR